MALGTKPRWDKYDGYVGNHRGVLAADIDLTEPDSEANKVLAVGKDSNGAVVIGAGQTGVNGLMIVPVGQDMTGTTLLDGGINNQAGDPCDVGAHGEITNFRPTTAAMAYGTAAAGTNYYGHADGSVTATAGTDGVYVGHTAEASRLIVDVSISVAEAVDATNASDIDTLQTDLAALTTTVDGKADDADLTALEARVTTLEGA